MNRPKSIIDCRLVLLLLAPYIVLLIEPVFSQEISGFDNDNDKLAPVGVHVSEGLTIKRVIVDFQTPTPGSPTGVYDQIPLRRTQLADEMLRVKGKVTLEVDAKEIHEEFTIELVLNLEFRQIVGIDARQYFSRLKDFKENRENLMLSAIKEKLKNQRFQFREFSDEDLLEKHSSPALEKAIEIKALGMKNEVVSTSPVRISSKWHTNETGLNVIEIPFKTIVYSDQLEPHAVYMVAFSQEIPHEQERVGMFYTSFAKSINF